MYLAYIVGTYPQASETFIDREVEGLRARGHEIDIYSLHAPLLNATVGVQYGWKSFADRAMRRLRPEAAEQALAARWHDEFIAGGYDGIVAHFGSQPSTVALEAAGELPLVISLHARDIYVEGERLGEKLARAQAVVTCTQANLTYLRELFMNDAAGVRLIYHGLPKAWLEAPLPKRERPRAAPLRLLAAGRLVEKKGFSTLIKACARLHEGQFPFQLRIVGDGPERAALEERCRRLGLAPFVTLDRWQSQQAMREVYAWADVFCCPSVLAADGDRDGLPNVLMEAMSTGLPAVGSRLSGIPEAIEDGVTGTLVLPGDADALAAAITRYADPSLRARHGAAAAQRIRTHFNGDHWLSELERVLDEVIHRDEGD